MRRLLLIVCTVAFLAQPARAEAGWFADSWQSTRACAARCTEKVKDFAAAQGARISAASDRARVWVRTSAARWTPEDRRPSYGLTLSAPPDDTKPLVVLVHGLDSGAAFWQDLADVLAAEGHQLAYFDFPNDQPIADSAKLLARELQSLHEAHPNLQTALLTHSMGGIVARSYVEGPDYAGGIDRLILLAPPNQGSRYARWNCCSEMAEHFALWRSDPNWHWTWPFIDGVGEAGRDLRPESSFLIGLNAQPRREGVSYTIIAGNRSCGWRYTAASLGLVARCVPELRIEADDRLRERLTVWAAQLRDRPAAGDGLVTVASTRLDGVGDFVIVPADHATIACSRDGLPPIAWETIRERLAR
jgi:pimeloyl-ACP methyl ester carboxylesterase